MAISATSEDGTQRMETVMATRERSGTEARLDATRPATRLPGQGRTIKPAQIAFGGSIVECALLDASRDGARVQLLAPAELPEVAILRLRSGESWTVRRQWQQGAQAGFRVVGTA
jgi:hypothetical protein